MLKKIHVYYYVVLLFLSAIVFFCTNTTLAQTIFLEEAIDKNHVCAIQTVYNVISSCNEDGQYLIQFSLTTDPSSQASPGFSVVVKDGNYSATFTYETLSYTIGPLELFSESDTLIITDIIDENCVYEVPIVTTPCPESGSCDLVARFDGYEEMIFCVGETLQLNNTSNTNEFHTLSWLVNGQIVSNTEQLIYPLESSGLYNVTLNVQTEEEISLFCSATTTISIIVKSTQDCPEVTDCQVKAEFTPPPTSSGCPNEVLTFWNISTGANQFNWYINGVLIHNQVHLQHTFVEVGTYEVRLLAFLYDQIACSTESTFTINIQNDGSCTEEARCQLTADFIPLTTTPICTGEEVMMDNLSTPDHQYQWAINDVIVSEAEDLEYQFLEAGVYQVQLLITDRSFPNCTHTKTMPIQVFSNTICGNCINRDCVFPGDGNADGVINSQDLLAMAKVYKQTGFPRKNRQTTFVGQAATDWLTAFDNGINHKHADANGDGVITEADFAVVQQNYMPIPSLHPELTTFNTANQQAYNDKAGGVKPKENKAKKKQTGTNTIQLRPVLLNQEETVDGQLALDIGVLIEQTGASAIVEEKVYGVSFSYSYLAPDSITADISYKNNTTAWQSWLGDIESTQAQDQLTTVDQLFTTPDQQSGHIEVGMARQAIYPINGMGILSRIGQVATIDDWVLKTVVARYSPTIDVLIDNIQILTVDGILEGLSTLVSIPLRRQTYTLSLKAYLEGAYNTTTGQMHTTLSDAQKIPLQQPFNTAPWNYAGVEIIDSSHIPIGIVDWVLVDLVEVNAPFQIVEQRAALLTANGTVIEADGQTNGINLFRLDNEAAYRICLRHRNHLAVLSATSISPNGGTILSYDFSLPNQVIGQQQQLALVDATRNRSALFAADFFANGIISVQDFNIYYNELLTNDGTMQYWDCDVNLDGILSVADFNLYNKNSSTIGVNWIRY